MTETLNLRPFDQLNKDEKIEATLAALENHASKELVFDYAGIDPESLGESELEKINTVFSRNQSEEEGKYIASQMTKDKLSQSIDMGTVYAKIADNHWDTMFGE